MSKQSKKQKKRRERQKKRRHRNLMTLFKDLYPKAPPALATSIINHYLETTNAQPSYSNTETVKQATLIYVRRHLTDYNQRLDDYTDAVLDNIEIGQPYQDQTPQTLEQEANRQARLIIERWQHNHKA